MRGQSNKPVTGEAGMKKLLISVALIGLANVALARDATKSHEAMIVTVDTPLTWAPSPICEKGALTANLARDRSKAERFIARHKYPPHCRAAQHYHTGPATETVLSARLRHGLGSKP